MKTYLAARFGRKEELLGYKAQLESLGFTVVSRWLLGEHEWSGVPDTDIPPEENARFATEDLEDIEECELVICFTEPGGSPYSRGGRHVEYGFALAAKKTLIIVGPRENIFYCLDRAPVMPSRITYIASWDHINDAFSDLFNWWSP